MKTSKACFLEFPSTASLALNGQARWRWGQVEVGPGFGAQFLLPPIQELGLRQWEPGQNKVSGQRDREQPSTSSSWPLSKPPGGWLLSPVLVSGGGFANPGALGSKSAFLRRALPEVEVCWGTWVLTSTCWVPAQRYHLLREACRKHVKKPNPGFHFLPHRISQLTQC